MADVKVVPYAQKPRAPIETFTEKGTNIQIRHRYFVDENGVQQCEPGDKLDLNAYIQRSKNATDIATIVAKLEAGDESVINVGSPIYGDIVSLPKNINDVVALDNVADRVKDKFGSLPDDLKALFNNDYRQFAISVLENKADSIIAGYASNKQKTPVEPAPQPAAVEGDNK